MTARSILELESAGFSKEQVRALAAYFDEGSISQADLAEIRGVMRPLRWMVGLAIALNIAILLRLLFSA